jgi:hypothetical protein
VKTRTHVRNADNPADTKLPKSFVIRTGKTVLDPLSSVFSQLVIDFRRMMEPHTASRIRVCAMECTCLTASRSDMLTSSRIISPWLVRWECHISFFSLALRPGPIFGSLEHPAGQRYISRYTHIPSPKTSKTIRNHPKSR